MEYRRLGRSGLKLSVLSYGAWLTVGKQIDLQLTKNLMAQAYAAGVNFFDNAEGYANGEAERVMGQALAELGWPRDSYCVSSKVYFGSAADPSPTQRGLSRKHVIEACNQALQRLRVDHLDLYFCHRPDPDVPIAETVWAMNQLLGAGKILYWGTSEWDAYDIQAAADFARQHHLIGPTMEQPQYNLLHRDRVERDYLPLFEGFGLGTTVFSPLASGLLSGKYAGGFDAGDGRLATPGNEWLRKLVLGNDPAGTLQQVAKLQRLAAQLGLPLAQLALAWCLRNPRVSSVILGASSAQQLAQNLAVLNVRQKLDERVWQDVERLLIGL